MFSNLYGIISQFPCKYKNQPNKNKWEKKSVKGNSSEPTLASSVALLQMSSLPLSHLGYIYFSHMQCSNIEGHMS